MVTYKHFIANSEVEGDALFLALQNVTGMIYKDVKINYRPDGKIVYHIAIKSDIDLLKLIEALRKKIKNKNKGFNEARD